MTRRRVKRALKRLFPFMLVASLALGVLAAHTTLFSSVIGQEIELRQTDVWFRLRGAIPTPEQLLIVSIDEDTYGELSLSTLAPLPRGVIADLLEVLARSGASLAIIDLFFRDPGSDPTGNDRLTHALSQMPTFIGAFQYEESGSGDETRRVIEVSPVKQFAEAAEKVVLMNILGHDTVRFFRLPLRGKDQRESLVTAYGERSQHVPSPRMLDLIRFYGPPGTVPQVSAGKVLRQDAGSNEAQFKGKTVLIGNALKVKTGFAVKDSFRTPVSATLMSGVEVHATVVANVMQNNWIRRGNLGRELLTVSLLLVMVAVIVAAVAPVLGLMVVAGAAVVWSLIAYAGFLKGVFIPGVLGFLVVLPVTFVVTTIAKHRALKSRFYQVERMLGLSDDGSGPM